MITFLLRVQYIILWHEGSIHLQLGNFMLNYAPRHDRSVGRRKGFILGIHTKIPLAVILPSDGLVVVV